MFRLLAFYQFPNFAMFSRFLILQENDAVVVCTGATLPRDLPIDGYFDIASLFILVFARKSNEKLIK